MREFSEKTGRKINPSTVEAVTLETYRYAQKLNAMDMEWAMGIQNKVSRTVGEAMRNFDVLLTPGLGRDVAKLGELNQNRRGVDVMSWWKQLMYD